MALALAMGAGRAMEWDHRCNAKGDRGGEGER